MDRNGEKVGVIWNIRFHSTEFTSIFDLRAFPFDHQSLVVRISSCWDETIVQFRASQKDSFRQCYDDYNLQDYRLGDCGVVDVETVASAHIRSRRFLCRSDPSSSSSAARYNSLFVYQNVSRHPGFYLLNLYLPTLLIASCSFVAYAMLPENFAGRSSILVVLLLTIVAFKQVVGQYLPRLPYLTYLDRYTLAGLGLVVFVGVMQSSLAAASICVSTPSRKPTLCGAVPAIQPEVDHADYICLVISAIIWLLYQVFEGLLICRASRIGAQNLRRDVYLTGEQEMSKYIKSEAKEAKKAKEADV